MLGDNYDAWAPVSVAGVSGATAVAAGGDHTCALINDGTVRCWGSDAVATAPGEPNWNAQPIAGLAGVSLIALGYHHSCAVVTDGQLRCWGHNGSGALGSGDSLDSSIPVPA